MADFESGSEMSISSAREVRLRSIGLHTEALSDRLKAQLALLDDDEIAVLSAIKAKLNSGLSANLREAANNNGGFIW